MKKKLLSMILTLAMVFSLMPTAFAGGEIEQQAEEPTYVAQIGETKYATLADAVAVGGEVTLLSNVTISETINVPKSVAIDLNGNVITSTVSDARLFELATADVSFKIDGTDANSAINSAGGSYGIVRASNTGISISIDGGTYNYDTAGGAILKANSTGTTFNIKNATIDTNAWILDCGDGDNNVAGITVQGGTYTSESEDGFILDIADGAVASFTDATITVAGVAVEFGGDGENAVNAILTNCTVTSTGDAYAAVAASYGTTMTIKSGSYTGVNLAAGAFTTGGKLVIEGGTFTGGVDKIDAGSENFSISIKGGTFDTDPTAYKSSGYYYVRDNGDGTYTVYYQAPSRPSTPSAPSTTTTTEKNEDGSTTTTVTDNKTGTKTETTENTDGSTTVVETNKDGSSTTTNTATSTETKEDGSTTTTETKTEEKVEADGTTTKTESTTTTETAADGSTTTTETKAEEKVQETVDTTTGTTTKTETKTETTTTKTETAEGATETKAETTATTTETVKDEAGNETSKTTETKTTTTTTEDAKGNTQTVETVKETTTDENGEEVVTETTKTDIATEDGSTSTTVVDNSGAVTSEVTVSEKAVEDAAAGEAPVTLPVPAVSATTSTETAATVTVKTNSAEPVTVAIPVEENTGAGTVAVLVNEDGTETIITESKVTENGLEVEVPDGATIKVVDNSTSFKDVKSSDWEKDAVDFASARGIMNGTGSDIFNPDQTTTRAMVWTMLARLSGVDTTTGSTWDEVGRQWAMENGISDGTMGDQEITREQLATMLWRYAGEPESDHDISHFNDDHHTSDWALDAKKWAVENGVMQGSNNNLMPKDDASRAQVAQMFMNYMLNI